MNESYKDLVKDRFGRQCSKCKEFKPWEEYYETPYGYLNHHSQCKLCIKSSLTPHPLPRLSEDKFGRKCKICNEYLPWASFGIDRGIITGHKPYCRVCRSKQDKARRKDGK